MSYAADGPVELAASLVEELGREVHYRPVTNDGALRAAERIASLLRVRS
jgi:hypothetical protein